MKTIPNLLDAAPWHVLSDGSLADSDFGALESMANCQVIPLRVQESGVETFLKPYPALRQLRSQTIFLKRLLDVLLVLPPETTVFSFDTDVFFRGPLRLSNQLPRFAYCVDEVPGYSGNPLMCLRSPLARALNGGLLIYRLADIDLKYLEAAAARYLLRAKTPFWIEQTLFSLIAGRLPDAACFSPAQCDIVSGLRKRPERLRRTNQTTYWAGLLNRGDDQAAIQRRIEQAWAIHFAGPGKKWIPYAASLRPKSGAQGIDFTPSPRVGSLERAMLAARVGARDVAHACGTAWRMRHR